MPFEIVRNDLSNIQVDAIVIASDPRSRSIGKAGKAARQKAKIRSLFARKEIGVIAVGDAALAPAFDLNAEYVIHTFPPLWQGGSGKESTLLESCYIKSLQLAEEHGCQSIAFPLLAAENPGFPRDLALQTAISAFSKFLTRSEMRIFLAVSDRNAFVLSEKLFQSVKSYIDDTYIHAKALEDYTLASSALLEECFGADRLAVADNAAVYKAAPAPRRLEDLMKELDETFSEGLLRLIDQKGLRDPDVYKKANIDRKLFSKIKNNKDYKPGKATCVAFAIALELSLDETRDLLGKAGYALTHSSKFDIIIEYFILEGNYNIFEINEVLFAFDQPLIGG